MPTVKTGFLDWLGGIRNLISILVALGLVASPVCWAVYQATQNEKDIAVINHNVNRLDADISSVKSDMSVYMKESLLSIQEIDKKLVRIETKQEVLIEDVRDMKNEN